MKRSMRKEMLECTTVILWVMAAWFAVAAFTGQWFWRENWYNSYTLQALRWTQGHLDLGQDYPWLELAIFGGKYYVSFPPFPSYLLLPFAAVFGENTPDGFLALLVLLVGVIYAMQLYSYAAKSTQDRMFFVLFLLLGNGYLFLTMNGWVWYIAQNLCFVLSLMALTHAFRGEGGISLAAWACAVGCRPMTVLYLPFLLILLYRAKKSREPDGTLASWVGRHWYWGIVPLLLAMSYMWLNAMRFGNPMEFGHNYLPEFTRTSTGQFDLSYFLPNLKELFRFPVYRDAERGLVFRTIGAAAVYLVNPLFLVASAAWISALLRKRTEERWTRILLPVMVLVHIAILCCHKTMGGLQFGNRYLVDILPWLFTGMLLWKPEKPIFARLSLPPALLGVCINLAGTIACYKQWN